MQNRPDLTFKRVKSDTSLVPTMSAEKTAKASEPQGEVSVHFIKAAGFRVVHANGTWFGGDPQGNLHLTFYSERTPLPKSIVVKVGENGQYLGEDEGKREVKSGVVREMEIDIVLSLEAATVLHENLGVNLRLATEAFRKAGLDES